MIYVYKIQCVAKILCHLQFQGIKEASFSYWRHKLGQIEIRWTHCDALLDIPSDYLLVGYLL